MKDMGMLEKEELEKSKEDQKAICVAEKPFIDENTGVVVKNRERSLSFT